MVSNRSTFLSFKPNDTQLRKYIAYYYFHYCDDENSVVKFEFYPNFEHAITAYQGSSFSIDQGQAVVKPLNNKIVSTPLYSINIKSKVGVSIYGKFNKIGIVFHPLGINAFAKSNLDEVISTYFEPVHFLGAEFLAELESIFELSSFEEKVSQLDFIFQQKLVHFQVPIIQTAVQLILESNGFIKVEELSEQLKVSRKTLLRLFKKHLFSSVEEYKKMVMFRKALIYAKENPEDVNLTDIALFSMYYDQAHFIKHFKSITKFTPNFLLEKIDQFGSEKTFWRVQD